MMKFRKTLKKLQGKKIPRSISIGFRIVHWGALAYVYTYFVTKASFEFSHPADVLAFYLPRALRYFDLTTYEYGAWAMRQAEGFPGLPSFIQGLLILVTRQINAVNTVNIVGFAAAAGGIYALYGQKFSMRWFLTFCLAVPLFYYHITIGFIDLFASSMILLAYAGLYSLSIGNRPKLSAVILILGCTFAMFSKMTVWPAAWIIAFFGFAALKKERSRFNLSLPMTIAFGILLAIGTAFYPARNYVLYGNPTHPLELRPYMKTLPAIAVISEIEEMNTPKSLVTKNQALSFAYSAFEVNRDNPSVPLDWSSFQNHGRPFERDQMGGFFALTVTVTLFFLLYIILVISIESLSISAFVLMAIVSANLPNSGVLRYSLFLPLIGFFLIGVHHRILSRNIRLALGVSFAICIAYVAPNLGPNFWTIDVRHHDTFAPSAARIFWRENETQNFAEALTVQGGYPSTIYWAGPNFKRWKIREELESRFFIPVRRIDQK